MTNRTKKVKNWLVDLGDHVAGSFNWGKLAFIIILFVVSTASYIFIKKN